MAATLPRPKDQTKGLKGTLMRMFNRRKRRVVLFDRRSASTSATSPATPTFPLQRRHSFTGAVQAAGDDDTLINFPKSLNLPTPSLIDASSHYRTRRRRNEFNDKISSAQKILEQLEREIDVFLAKLEAATDLLVMSSSAFAKGKKKGADGLKEKNSGADDVWFGTTARDSIECLLEKLRSENNGRTPNWAKMDGRHAMKAIGGTVGMGKTAKRPKDKTMAGVADSKGTTTLSTTTDDSLSSSGDDNKDSSSLLSAISKSSTIVSRRRRQQGRRRRRRPAPLKGKTRLVVDLLEAFQRKPTEERRELIRSGLDLLRVVLADDKEDVAKPKKNN